MSVHTASVDVPLKIRDHPLTMSIVPRFIFQSIFQLVLAEGGRWSVGFHATMLIYALGLALWWLTSGVDVYPDRVRVWRPFRDETFTFEQLTIVPKPFRFGGRWLRHRIFQHVAALRVDGRIKVVHLPVTVEQVVLDEAFRSAQGLAPAPTNGYIRKPFLADYRYGRIGGWFRRVLP